MKKIFILLIVFLLGITLMSCNATTTTTLTGLESHDINFTFTDNTMYNLDSGLYSNNINYGTSTREDPLSDTFFINNYYLVSYALFWNANNYYIGYYAMNSTYTEGEKYIATIHSNTINMPTGAKKVAFMINKNNIDGYYKLNNSYLSDTYNYIISNGLWGDYPVFSIDDPIDVVSGYSNLTYRDVFGDNDDYNLINDFPTIQPLGNVVYNETVGKNLFDGVIELGNIDPQTGSELVSTIRIRNVEYIQVKASTTYTLSYVGTSNYGRVFYYDKDYNFISAPEASVMPFDFTTTSDTAYIRFYDDNAGILTNTYQIELGTTATIYEAYNISNYLGYQKYSINDISDTNSIQYFGLDYNNVMQSTTGWSTLLQTTNIYVFRKDLTTELGYKETADNTVVANIYLKIDDTIFPIYQGNGASSRDLEWAGIDINYLVIGIAKTKIAGFTSADFEAYLQANDVQFVYELNTPITTGRPLYYYSWADNVIYNLTTLFLGYTIPSQTDFEKMLTRYEYIMNNATYDSSGDGINDTIIQSQLDYGLNTITNGYKDSTQATATQSKMVSDNISTNHYINYISNGNFKDDSNGDGLADYWYSGGGMNNFSITDGKQKGYSGNTSYYTGITTNTAGPLTSAGNTYYWRVTIDTNAPNSFYYQISLRGGTEITLYNSPIGTNHNITLSGIGTSITDNSYFSIYIVDPSLNNISSEYYITVDNIVLYPAGSAPFTSDYESFRDNIFPNYDLSIDSNSDGIPDGWTDLNVTGTYDNTFDELKIEADTTNYNHYIQTSLTDYEIGQQYRLDYSINFNNANVHFKLSILQKNEDGSFTNLIPSISYDSSYAFFIPTEKNASPNIIFRIQLYDSSYNNIFIGDGSQYITLINNSSSYYLINLDEYSKSVYDNELLIWNYTDDIYLPMTLDPDLDTHYLYYMANNDGAIIENLAFIYVKDDSNNYYLPDYTSQFNATDVSNYIDTYYNSTYNSDFNFNYGDFFESIDLLNALNSKNVFPYSNSEMINPNNSYLSQALTIYWDYQNGEELYIWYTDFGITEQNFTGFYAEYLKQSLETIKITYSNFSTLESTSNIITIIFPTHAPLFTDLNNWLDNISGGSTYIYIIITVIIFIVTFIGLALLKADVYILLFIGITEIAFFTLINWIPNWIALFTGIILLIVLIFKILRRD